VITAALKRCASQNQVPLPPTLKSNAIAALAF
jgi:hypothetical protein